MGSAPANSPATNGRRSRSTSRAGSTPPTTRRSHGSTGSNSNSPGGDCSSPAACPVCPQVRLRGIDSRQAIASCGGALVGRGQLYAKIFVPNQAPFGIRANLLAFNGQTKVGRPAVLVHAYTTDPPVSFVIPFAVHRQKGAFRTVLVTTLKRSVGTWPHVSDFRIEVARDFIYHGKRHSYLSASCPVPPKFTAGFLSFARATYTFAGGEELAIESVRSCRARKTGRYVKGSKAAGREGQALRSAFPHRIADFPRQSPENGRKALSGPS